ncbi:hypothetical protein EJ110_NYTH36867 [Nymphaea thermarum]|nr:hypothetical protein EJ110_NYTH36867 [Nymphaea thermarum]
MKVHRRHQYMEALQEELNKIKVFQSELPLSLHLVSQAIDACRRQIAIETTGYQSESVETTCEGAPLLEEFIPIRRNSDDNQEQDHRKEEDKSEASHDRGNKPDWLRSAQLWNQDPEISPTEDVDSSRKSSSSETKRGASSSPCRRGEKALPATAAVSDPSASAAAEGHDKEGNVQKKARRCWSPELHRRFLHALQQLGGSHEISSAHKATKSIYTSEHLSAITVSSGGRNLGCTTIHSSNILWQST